MYKKSIKLLTSIMYHIHTISFTQKKKKKKLETSILSHYDLFDGIMIHYVHQMDKHLRK